MATSTVKKKGILKFPKKVRNKYEKRTATQSSTIDAVRWDMPDLEQPYNSAPSMAFSRHTRGPQRRSRNCSMKELSSLQECVQFIHHWKEQVDQLCKPGCGQIEEAAGQQEAKRSTGRAQRSLEESRKLILEWAGELRHVDKLLQETSWARDSQEHGSDKGAEAAQETHMQIMEWAKELKMAAESCGMQSEKLKKVVHLLSQKKRLLVRLVPLLEFITWSLLKEDGTKTIPQLWLLVKQRTWKAGIPRYIPNSVWSWISSAAADVTLDPMTSNPWLLLSKDRRRVQEGHMASDPPSSSQRFDSWPCVLGWEGYGAGRHYWEVDIANGGCWRAGMTTSASKRHGHFPMTPKHGYWVLWRSARHLYVCSKPETELPVGLAPQRLGVYLDYEEGQISFYNAETKSHIYTFTGAFRGKLYPLVAPMDGHTLMTIRAPDKISAK
ncbi:E3 ubiquitin-protein ligase TRIM21 [Salarias fasciatus]|uniref:E3 ubiquitin-protein ligase TRIM21 n=1 Tax=Salarias fasciatus TaxID=181472 RepID=UPI0011769460|nr:E3 ubiquitin-protein ligase TRIM21-like [Salarias fasciatus]